MHYRSISAHRGCPDPQIIELAAKLGFNDVCFEVEGKQSYMLAEIRDRADRSRLFERIKSHGMTVSIWVHEFEEIPSSWGAFSPENETLWQNIKQRYLDLLTKQLPEIDYLVLTVVESSIRCTDPAMLEKLVSAIREACLESGKKLMLRSFVWTLEEFEGVRQTIANLPDDILIMTKYVPQDWHRGDNHDPLIGNVGEKTQFVELDVAGEYFRGDYLGHCFAKELHERFAYWKEKGVQGVQARVHRGWYPWLHHENPLYEIQESNLWCLGMWMTGEASDLETPLQAWAGERFGEKVASEVAEIALLCDPVIKEALTVCGEPFGDTRRNMPALRSMLPPKEEPATIYRTAKATKHVDPFSRLLALWRWDPSLKPRYDKLRKGDPSCVEQKKQEYAAALVKANQAIEKLELIKSEIDRDAYEFLRFKLEENRHHLVLMCESALAWLACLRLPQVEERERATLHSAIESHLDAAYSEWEAHSRESAVVVWPEGQTRQLKRCEYLDIPGFCREMRRYACIN